MNTVRVMAEQGEIEVEEDQFLTFKLDGQEYGISALKVQEIKRWDKVTPIPNSPLYVRGVLNLRGLIVPIIDLRLFFNLKEIEYTPVTAIIVMNVGGRLAGIVVDSVSDVINVSVGQQCAAPEYEGQKNREFIKGLAHADDKLLILLDMDRMIKSETLDQTEAAAPSASTL